MTCLHRGTDCETPFLEPFVAHLNAAEGSDYRLYSCLDRFGRGGPKQPQKQPEALYKGERSGLLTIERKILSWPPEAIKLHTLWHLFCDPILANQKPFNEAPYKLLLPEVIPLKVESFDEARTLLVQQLIDRRMFVQSGAVFQGTEPFRFSFRTQHKSERDEDRPQTGIMIETRLPTRWSVTPEEEAGISELLCKYLKACSEKFSIWKNTRRVLLLEPHGDIVEEALYDGDWKLHLGDQVDEIWTATYYGETFLPWSLNWGFKKIFPEEVEYQKASGL